MLRWFKLPAAMPQAKINAVAKSIQRVERQHGVRIVAAFAETKRQPAATYKPTTGKAK